MRSPRSLLETIRAFRSQINSLSRLWSHPRGAAGSQGISLGSWWHCQGESTMTTLHAHTPSRLLTTAIRGLRLDHPRIDATTATGYYGFRWPSLVEPATTALPELIAAPHFWDTSNQETASPLCNCVLSYIARNRVDEKQPRRPYPSPTTQHVVSCSIDSFASLKSFRSRYLKARWKFLELS